MVLCRARSAAATRPRVRRSSLVTRPGVGPLLWKVAIEAQAGAAVVELVPSGAVKTSRLVTSRDSEGNTIVEEREVVAADHAAGVAHLPQGTILRKTKS